MANYIKRTDVMKICEDYSAHCFKLNDANGQDIADRILDDVVEIPISDVEEVKHGEWSLKHIGVGHYWECSECEFKNAVMPRTNYCPNCGAKMDGGKME